MEIIDFFPLSRYKRVCKQEKLYKQKLKTTEKVIVKIALIV